MTKDVFWFTHDANATDDEKIMLLIDQLGLEGYGIYWVLIEKLRSSDQFKLSFTIVPILARRYNTTTEKMMTVVRQYNLFEFDDENFFFSPSLIIRMQKWVDKKEKNSIAGKISAQKRLGLINNKFESQQVFNTCSTSVQHMFNKCSTRIEQNRIEQNRIEQNRIEQNRIEENKFSFRKALIKLGIDEQIVDDWIIVRKNKKASNTETAYNSIKKQIDQCNANANECIKMAVEHSWQGFKSEWYDNEIKKQSINIDALNNDNKKINGVEYK